MLTIAEMKIEVKNIEHVVLYTMFKMNPIMGSGHAQEKNSLIQSVKIVTEFERYCDNNNCNIIFQDN